MRLSNYFAKLILVFGEMLRYEGGLGMKFLKNFFGIQRLNKQTLPIGGANGLSPEVRLLEHKLYGSIITSKYNIVRFFQDNAPVCYNAALAMYMYSTREVGAVYKEMAYYDDRKASKYDGNRGALQLRYIDGLISQLNKRGGLATPPSSTMLDEATPGSERGIHATHADNLINEWFGSVNNYENLNYKPIIFSQKNNPLEFK